MILLRFSSMPSLLRFQLHSEYDFWLEMLRLRKFNTAQPALHSAPPLQVKPSWRPTFASKTIIAPTLVCAHLQNSGWYDGSVFEEYNSVDCEECSESMETTTAFQEHTFWN